MNDRDQETGYGEDTLRAHAYGDDIPAIKMDALDQARELYGPEVRLQIERVSNVATAIARHRGKFYADVVVRRLDGDNA